MGTLFVVATPIGNLSDLTKRAEETLNSVDFILCEDTRHSLKLMNHLNIKKPLYAYHKFNEREVTEKYLNKIVAGANVALITDAGTPCISDPGYIIVKEARKLDIPIIGVGGISAVVTALSISGLDTKHFIFYGFIPRETKDKKDMLNLIATSEIPLFVFYESPKRIVTTLEFLEENFPSALVSLSSDLTKIHERTYYGNISKVLNELKENPNHELGEYTLAFDRNSDIKQEENITLEALLIDIMIKENVTLKEAIKKLNERKDIKKSDIYTASLNIKDKIFK